MQSAEDKKRLEIVGDFRKYCKFMLPDFKFKKHQLIYINRLYQSIERLIGNKQGIFKPARHGKTLFGADMFLTYMFGRFPNKTGAYGTYGEEFAKLRRDAFELIVTSERYIWLFPNTRIKSSIDINEIEVRRRKSSKNTSYCISNVLGGGKIVFVGRGNPLTGIGLHYGACDDLYKDGEEAQSLKVNEKIFDWFVDVWLKRAEKGCIYWIFYTRWVSDDVAGRLLIFDQQQKEAGNIHHIPWETVRFPGYKDEFDDNPYDDRKFGEPLDPDMVAEYEQARIKPDSFMAMVQQTPIDAQGKLFRLHWFPRYEVRHKLTYKVISIDSQFKATGKNVDRTAISTWGLHNNRIHMHWEFINEKMDFDELVKATVATIQAHPDYWAILVEDSANGQALMNYLQKHFRGVIGVKPNSRGKRENAQLCIPTIKNFEVVIPNHILCPKIGEFEHEITNFSGLDKNEKDDLADTMFQAVIFYNEMRPYASSQGILTVQNQNPMLNNSQGNIHNQVMVVR